MEEIFQLISAYGFPMVICVYMIVVNNKTMNANTTAINKLTDVVNSMKEILHAVVTKE